MNDYEIRKCTNPNHPFKQKTYKYYFGYESSSSEWCSSCASNMKFAAMMITVFLQPRETLYGNKMIQLTREQAKQLVDTYYDVQEELNAK